MRNLTTTIFAALSWCAYAVDLIAQNQPDLITLKIETINENDAVVENAAVRIFNYTDEDRVQPKGNSNAAGLLSVPAKASPLTEISVNKTGYYPSLSVPYPKSLYQAPGEQKQPFRIVLKTIKSPIALYAKNLTTEGGGPLKIPIESQDVGFDLLIGDWLPPHGNGRLGDLIFRYDSEDITGKDYHRRISIRFSNDGDGLIPFDSSHHVGSLLISDYHAPKEGYIPTWSQTSFQETGGAHKTTRKDERNYYFRIRTKVNQEGAITSAHYGKIYGDFMSFMYFLNSNPNDRNVEFDPERNLFKNLNLKEKVDRP